ncbi:MAG: MarR family EPS-associated transcriptional regulator [Chromatiales bacterium]|nr:MarR family EPS-associated transcriptional regulator [Gammaproteobacteria bacterium]MBW6477561.1 MarR family EPS-associated transcriptional regulator [Chromatiales bacterium]
MPKSVLSDEIRYQLLKQLEDNPAMTQREMASAMGISLGKLNYCLKALIEKGWVKAGNFRRNKDKLGYAYLLTPKGVNEKTRVTLAFLARKQQEYDQLAYELESLRQEVAGLQYQSSAD